MRRRRTRRILVVISIMLVGIVLFSPPQASAQALNDPQAFWNALKVALGGGTGSVVGGVARFAVTSFTGGGWVVAGGVVVGAVGYGAYALWKAANSGSAWQGANWELTTVDHSLFDQTISPSVYFRINWDYVSGCSPTIKGAVIVSWAPDAPYSPNPPGTWPWPKTFSCTDATDHWPAVRAEYESWLSAVGATEPTSGPYWPGTTEIVPATLEAAMADSRWNTLEDEVAGYLPQALEDRRSALGGAYPARLEDYAGSGAYDTTFSNPQAVAQPGNPGIPQPADPSAPATAGYLRDLIAWLGDLWRAQIAWLAGIIETWQSRVVTELQGVKEAIQTLPATISEAVSTAVTEAVDAAFAPSQAALDAWGTVPSVAAEKFPFSIPAALQFPDIAASGCTAPSWSLNMPSLSSGNLSTPGKSIDLSLTALCPVGPVVRPVATFFLGVWAMTVLLKLIMPRLSL